jgi:hypothetical protein
MRKMMGLTLVFCLAFGLTVAACTTANADIDKSTVEAGRVHIKGKIGTAHDLVVRIDRGDKPIEWRSSRTGGGEFEVIVEASDKIRLEGGQTGHGFVVSHKQGAATAITYVPCVGDLAGTFAIRRESDFVTKDGVLTFADITLKDGKKLPVSLRLALSRIAAPVRADDPKDKAAPAAQVKKPGAVFKVPGHTMDVALTADGKILASAGTGKTIDLWDVASGKQLHTLKGHTAPLFKVAFSPDGKTLASGTGNVAADKFDRPRFLPPCGPDRPGRGSSPRPAPEGLS